MHNIPTKLCHHVSPGCSETVIDSVEATGFVNLFMESIRVIRDSSSEEGIAPRTATST
jgi:hypothetical protein